MKRIKQIINYISLKIKPYYLIIKYDYKTDSLKIKTYHTFEDRAIKTLELFMIAFEQIKNKIKGNFTLKINTGDYCCSKRKIFAYSNDESVKNKIVSIPDFFFINWKETGVDDYDELCKKIVDESKKAYKYNKLFWIGNQYTHKTREKLLELSKKDNRIEAYGMQWNVVKGKNTPTKYVSLIDHVKYKYLIDIQGNGWSARTKVLFFTGRPLFLVDRKWKEYWYKDIKPFIHYIPVKEDLSDLVEKIDWAEKNYKKANLIAKNAQKFAINNLTKSKAIEEFEKIIVNASIRK